MLYERWCRVVAEHRHETALRELATGRHWTFGELRAAGEAWDCGDSPVVHPQGNTPEFLFAVLAAWRTGKVVCPIEVDQAPPQVSLPPKHCVHLKTTSATTGSPRMVAFTAEQLAADAENIVATMGLRPDWPNLGVISMAHSYGFSNLALPLLLHGIPLVLGESPLPESVRRAAGSEPAVTLAAVPALWRAWFEAGAITANVRLAISAGAPLSVSIEGAVFTATGIKLHNFYGSTECGGIAYDASATPRTDDALAGAPMRNVELSVADNGCLEVRSRAVAETYWRGEAADEPALARQSAATAAREDARPTLSALGQGRFQTTDLAELKDGLVYLRGRLTDLINVAGRKVSPLTIEQALGQHPSVRGCVVFGVPDRDADRGELIVAGVMSQSAVTGEELKRFLLEWIPAWQIPRDWWFVESLTSNQLGKISRAEWRIRYAEIRGSHVGQASRLSP